MLNSYTNFYFWSVKYRQSTFVFTIISREERFANFLLLLLFIPVISAFEQKCVKRGCVVLCYVVGQLT